MPARSAELNLSGLGEIRSSRPAASGRKPNTQSSHQPHLDTLRNADDPSQKLVNKILANIDTWKPDRWSRELKSVRSNIQSGNLFRIPPYFCQLACTHPGRLLELIAVIRENVFRYAGQNHETDPPEPPNYFSDFSQILGPDRFSSLLGDIASKIIVAIGDSQIGEIQISELVPLLDPKGTSSPELIHACVRVLGEIGCISEVSENTILANWGKVSNIRDHIHQLCASYRAYKHLQNAGKSIGRPNWEETRDLYIENEKRITAPTFTIPHKRDVLYLSDLLIGNYRADVYFVDEVIKYLEKKEPKQRPHTVVCSALIQGDFSHNLAHQRPALVDELDNVDSQLAVAHDLMQRFRSLGIRVIYSMTDTDDMICRAITLEELQKLRSQAKRANKRKLEEHIPYHQQHKLQLSQEFAQVNRFVREVVYPYMLRTGRRLRTEEEIERMTKGKIRMSEYELLRILSEKIQRGEQIDPLYRTAVDIKALTDHWLAVADDLQIKTLFKDGTSHTTCVIHNAHLADTASEANPVAPIIRKLNQELAAGKKIPDLTAVTGHNFHMGIAVDDNKYVVSTPSPLNPPELTHRGHVKRARDRSARIGYRPIPPSSGMVSFRHTGDGRMFVTIYDKQLMDLADISANRVTLLPFGDFQIGSITAIPDFFVTALDIARQRTEEGEVFMEFLGDQIQGRIYPDMPNENQHLGLLRIDSQIELLRRLILRSFADATRGELERYPHIGIIPGNHEWNNYYHLHGSDFTQWLELTFREIFLRAGVEPDGIINRYDAAATRRGDFLRSWIIHKEIAGYGVTAQHMIMERGAKGQLSGPPILQGASLIHGLGGFMDRTKFFLTGHWHNGQWCVLRHKVIGIIPPLARASGYEYMRGYRPNPGAMFIHLGGGKPPELELISAQHLATHEILRGDFNRRKLAKEGFRDDEHFDPLAHGFSNPNSPRSALQKALWHEARQVSAGNIVTF
jgi:hypothetical protein